MDDHNATICIFFRLSTIILHMQNLWYVNGNMYFVFVVDAKSQNILLHSLTLSALISSERAAEALGIRDPSGGNRMRSLTRGFRFSPRTKAAADSIAAPDEAGNSNRGCLDFKHGLRGRDLIPGSNHEIVGRKSLNTVFRETRLDTSDWLVESKSGKNLLQFLVQIHSLNTVVLRIMPIKLLNSFNIMYRRIYSQI